MTVKRKKMSSSPPNQHSGSDYAVPYVGTPEHLGGHPLIPFYYNNNAQGHGQGYYGGHQGHYRGRGGGGGRYKVSKHQDLADLTWDCKHWPGAS